MRQWAFAVGIAMIAYDMAGHGCALLARLTGNRGASLWECLCRLYLAIPCQQHCL